MESGKRVGTKLEGEPENASQPPTPNSRLTVGSFFCQEIVASAIGRASGDNAHSAS
jgi:hypothetical protein